MNHKFTLMAMALACIATLPARAADYLIVDNASAKTEFNLSTVKSLTFTDGNLSVATLDGKSATSFPLSNKLVLKFSDVSTGIATLPTGRGDNTKLVYQNGYLSMDGITRAQAMLFNTAGQCVRKIVNWDGSAVGTDNLPTGVYIFKVNQQTIKFVKH